MRSQTPIAAIKGGSAMSELPSEYGMPPTVMNWWKSRLWRLDRK